MTVRRLHLPPTSCCGALLRDKTQSTHIAHKAIIVVIVIISRKKEAEIHLYSIPRITPYAQSVAIVHNPPPDYPEAQTTGIIVAKE